MSSHVLPKRFVNTPTVGELYKEEHPEAALDVSEDDVEELSKEYDANAVGGNEGYYKLLFQEIHNTRRATPGSVTGNEGVMSWAKDMVTSFIAAIKKFFKWIWSWFGGKEEDAKKKASTISERLKMHGVKDGDIPYPKSYTDLWGKPTKVPASLSWMSTSLTEFEKALEQAKKHKEEFKKFANGIDKVLVKGKSTSISQNKAALDKYIDAYGKAVQAIYANKNGQWAEWVGIGLVNVSKDGKVSVSVNNKILPQKAATPTFKTNTTEVGNLLGKLKTVQDKWFLHNRDMASLEKVTIDQMNEALEFCSTVAAADQKAADQLVGRVKKIAGDVMVTIRAEDNLFANLVLSGYNILSASINDNAGPKSGKGKDDAA